MNVLIIGICIIFIVIIWFRIDFIVGKCKQRKETKHVETPLRHSELELLSYGEEFFHSLLKDIKQAKEHIHLLFYIFRDDYIGSKLITLLEEKVQAGVDVRLLVDYVGNRIEKKRIKQMKKIGVEIAFSHKPSFPLLFFTYNQRNHRKIVIIDGKIGYVGGSNIGDEYLGRNALFGMWRDFQLRMTGDGVQDLQTQFLHDWGEANEPVVMKETLYPPLQKQEQRVQIVPSDGTSLKKMFISFIQKASTSIVIGTPYYIPGKAVQKELINAAKRGVDVKLIVPKKADHPLVKEASYTYFGDLLEAGIQIYQYYRGFYHVKAIVIDDLLCSIGTANFDKRSFYINFEINCFIYDRPFIREVTKKMAHDIAVSKRLTLKEFEARSLYNKGKEKVASLVSGLL